MSVKALSVREKRNKLAKRTLERYVQKKRASLSPDSFEDVSVSPYPDTHITCLSFYLINGIGLSALTRKEITLNNK